MDDQLKRITDAVIDLDEQLVLELVQTELEQGESSLHLIQACERGMRGVGDRYERQEYYLSGLIMASEIFRQVMTLTQPGLEVELTGSASGKVLLGTVAGDIHDIGKNMVRMALRSFGFTVTDLGIDVPPRRFVEEAKSLAPDIVGLSGLVSASYDSMRETVALLRYHAGELGREIPVIIGGGTIDARVCEFVGADYWTTDAMEGVRICQRITAAE